MTYKFFMMILIVYFIIILIKETRKGIIIGLTFTTFCISAYPWSFVFTISGIATIIKILMIILPFLYYFIFKKKYNLNAFTIDKYILFTILLFGIMTFMLYFSNSQSYGIYKTVFFLYKSILPILAFSMLFPIKKEELSLIINTIIFGSVLMVFNLLILSDITISRVTYDEDLNPITIARTLGLGLVLSFTSIIVNTKLSFNKSILYFIISLSIFTSMLFTGSRGPLIFSLIAVVLVVILNKSIFMLSKGKIFLIVTLPITILVFSKYLFSELIKYKSIERLFTYLTFGSNASDVGRLERFKIAIKEIKESYFLGIGTGGFDSVWMSNDNSIYDYPHNIFLEVQLELGISGLIVLILLFLLPIIRKLKTKSINNYDDLVFGLFIYSFLNAMVSGDIQSNYILWTSGGLLAFICKYNKFKINQRIKMSYI